MEPGYEVTIRVNLWNEGLGGGKREIGVSVGYEGNESDPIVKKFSKNFSPMEASSLQFSVVTPQDPNASQFPHRRPVVCLWNIDPATGKKVLIGALAGRVTEYRVNAEDRKAMMDDLRTAQAKLPMYASDGVTIIGQGGRVASAAETVRTNTGLNMAGVLVASVSDDVSFAQGILNYKENLGVVESQKGFSGVKKMKMAPESDSRLTFTLSVPMMVNVVIDHRKLGMVRGTATPASPDIDLRIEGGGLSEALVSSSYHPLIPRDEVVSRLLPAGTYTITLDDRTKYGALGKSPFAKFITVPDIPLELDMKPITGSIEGRIVNEAKDVKPVRMHRAAFDSTGKRLAPESLPTLDPTKPVWIVVHGMNSSEDFDTIQNLTRELTLNSAVTQQVISIDWHEAASAWIGGDAPWTPLVGKWVAEQLLMLGFSPGKVNFVGHSHGTYVSYCAARKMMNVSRGEMVSSIVALDPAGNFATSTGFDESHINFRDVAKRSVAIEGSWASGSNSLAGTADVAFQVDSPETNSTFFLHEHSLPVTTFTNLLKNAREVQTNIPEYVRLDVIAGIRSPAHFLRNNIYKDVYEGVITVQSQAKKSKLTGEIYYDAMPSLIEYQDDAGDWKTRLIPNDATMSAR
jgi:pimeloyl-ACP methyl ester carboxylesterase